MAPDDRATKSAERCSLHPGIPSVARCVGCGRPLCLTCAVPVRGRVFGAECLAEAIGQDPVAGFPLLTRPRRLARAAAGTAFAVAAAATVLPWSTRNVGSGPFGAWGLSPRWSLLAAVPAGLGLVVWIALAIAPPRRQKPWYAALALLGATVAAGALLAIWHPPAFSDTLLAPWLAAITGAAACVASLSARRGLGDETPA